MPYPAVLSEEHTLDAVVAGASIARFGDGEFKIVAGGRNATHAHNPALTAELRRILVNPAPNLLPAIPHPRAAAARWKSWSVWVEQWAEYLDPQRIYGSAFVGRDKVAPWIDTPDYHAKFHRVWRGRLVSVIAPLTHPVADMLERNGARLLEWIACPKAEAFEDAQALVDAAVMRGPQLVVLCAGPAATVMADRIARLGIQAVDLGRGSGFLIKKGGA